MTVFFTADTHFGHGGALGFYRRPFASVAEMDAAMIERWNRAVGPTDSVWHLGDFAIRRSADQVAALLDRLNGTKHLVIGNNHPTATTAHPACTPIPPYPPITPAAPLFLPSH